MRTFFQITHNAAGTVATGNLTSDSVLTLPKLNAHRHIHFTPVAVHAAAIDTNWLLKSFTIVSDEVSGPHEH
ncbi:hypothetical protein BLNAU_5001 [Blattamonas nauphoetae]|uniref:Uncharacterized protein n=1 Tax=Blattamonas nauphoetae TaxID=2049346 RepID=A0ABQ9Y8M3_9EUKA|nr:hypothetical protein BLNAU_5001 [Blattamonas nauphoetae]